MQNDYLAWTGTRNFGQAYQCCTFELSRINRQDFHHNEVIMAQLDDSENTDQNIQVTHIH